MSKMNIRRIIKEEIDDFDWIRNAAINFEDVNLRVGDKFRVPTLNPDGSTFSIVTIIDIGLRGNEPITYRRESGMGQLQQRNLVDSKVDFIRRIIKDKWKPFYYNRGFKLYESDDFGWIRDVTPRVFDLLDIATKDNPRINVYFYKGDFIRILDRNGMNYFDAHDIGDYLGVEPEEVYDISKKDLMRYILGNHILGGSWHGYIDPKNIKDSSNYDTNEDYKDYVDLYELVKSL